MLKPSYSELMEKLNEKSTDEDKPIISSRYSIVIAAAKRARQIVENNNVLLEFPIDKPVSIAVEELFQGKIVIKDKDKMPIHVEEIDIPMNNKDQNDFVNNDESDNTDE